MSTSKKKRLAFLKTFTIVVFILLASIDNAASDAAKSVYWAMEISLGTTDVRLGFINSLLIWIISSSAIFWGYLGDKGNRKRLLLIGTAIWCVSLVFSPLVKKDIVWLIVEVFAGIGLGCIASVGFSVIVDFVSPEKRGLALSFWGLSQGAGSAMGSVIGALYVQKANQWWIPFFTFAIIGFILLILYFFTLDPQRGGSEKELQNVDYEYIIKKEDFKVLLKKKTNLALLFQGLTAQVVWGSITWLPYVFMFAWGISHDGGGFS
ncbi:MAG: MFS transporter [Candidatus Lokiarchaeota archaeon]|nr:MFS transporter [Candidatus Lokiarchaeota archaeon]